MSPHRGLGSRARQPRFELAHRLVLGNAVQRRIDRFVLIESVGRGGMGVVWRARQRSLGRIMAPPYGHGVLAARRAREDEEPGPGGNVKGSD